VNMVDGCRKGKGSGVVERSSRKLGVLDYRFMSPARALFLSLALLGWGLASLGCTEVLGLDGLTFEEPDDDPSAGPGDAGVDSEGAISLGGDPASLAVDERRFPTLLGPMKYVVGRPDTLGDTPYVVYDPANGHLESHRVDAYLNRYEIAESWEWERDWSLVYQVPRAEGTMLIGYNAELGLAEQVPTDDDVGKQQSGELIAGTPGWTDLVPIATSEGWQVLAYSQDTGHYRFGRALLEDADGSEVRTGTWPDTWTLLVPHPLEQGAAVLKYDAGTGDAELEQLTGSAEQVGNRWRGNLGGGWSSIVTFLEGADVLVLLYEAEQGRAMTGTLSVSDDLSLLYLESSAWREGISHVVPMRLGSKPYAMTYSEDTGVAELRTVSPLEDPLLALE
jgi:hypothetical protein